MDTLNTAAMIQRFQERADDLRPVICDAAIRGIAPIERETQVGWRRFWRRVDE